MEFQLFQQHLLKRPFLLIYITFVPLSQISLCGSVWGSLLFSVLYLFVYLTSLSYLHKKIWKTAVNPLLFKYYVDYSRSLLIIKIQNEFQSQLLCIHKITCWILIEIDLDLQIKFERTGIFALLSLPICEHELPLCLFSSSLIFFNRILQFFSYKGKDILHILLQIYTFFSFFVSDVNDYIFNIKLYLPIDFLY